MRDQRCAGVSDAIEKTPAEAENLKLRSPLKMALEDDLKREGLKPAYAARRLGGTRPRVSDLMSRKITPFGLDTLLDLVLAHGQKSLVRDL